jgi:hypothetical protein
MKKVALQDVKPSSAPKHFIICALKLHRREETEAHKFWVGLSHFLPQGAAAPCSTSGLCGGAGLSSKTPLAARDWEPMGDWRESRTGGNRATIQAIVDKGVSTQRKPV